MIYMKNRMFCLLIMIALLILCIGFVNVSATENHPIALQTTRLFSEYNHTQEPDSGVLLQNVTIKLDYWNDRMHWGLSQRQISEYSIKAENQILKNLTMETSGNNTWYHIKNLTRFDEELGTIIGLSDLQISAFIIEDRKQLERDHMNYFKETPFPSPEKTESLSREPDIATNSPSAVFANEQTLLMTPQNKSLPGFGFPTCILTLLIILISMDDR